MANCSHPSLSPTLGLRLLLLIIIIITTSPVVSAAAAAAATDDDGLLFLGSTTTAATDFQEVESMMETLRNHGSTLFSNAIATSDIQYQLFATSAAASAYSNFTIFAPRDTLLYSLDMISDSATYVSTLRYHVIPNQRHTFLDLQNLSSPFLDTLLPHYSVLIGKTQDDNGDLPLDINATTSVVMVDGVRVSTPDLFLGSTIAVHGIDGILVTGLNMHQDFNISLPPEPQVASPESDTTGALTPPPMSEYLDWNKNAGPAVALAPAPAPEADQSPESNENNLGKRHYKRGRSGNGSGQGQKRRRHRRLRGVHLDDL